MSKFIEKLKQHTQVTPAPMGFGKAPAQEKTRIMFIALVSKTDSKNLRELTRGADAVLVESESLESLSDGLSDLKKTIPDAVLGGWVNNVSPTKTNTANIDSDFIAFSPESPLVELPVELGRMLEVGIDTPDAELRAIDDLPVEAVLFTDKPEQITWHYIIAIQRLENLLTKPILAFIPESASISELQTLWSVGVDAVVIEISTPGRIVQLQADADKVIFPLPRKSKKADVRLPFVSPPSQEESEEEEEGE